METYLKKMSKEHKKLFPRATLETQVKKLEEEINEVIEADGYNEIVDELADCLIVCCGIYRFAKKVALNNASNFVGIAEAFGFKSILFKRAEEKWKINLSRKWSYRNGKYHHKGVENEKRN